MTGRFRFFALFFLLSRVMSGDVGLRPVTRDFDAEFARAADLLEAGERPDAETVLSEILRQAGQPAWEARVAFLLAADDLRRRDFAVGAERMHQAPAASIGLEVYRHDRLARLLSGAGRTSEASAHWKIAFEVEESRPVRVRIARDLSRELEKAGRTAEALEALEKVAPLASSAEIAPLALERIRLGRALRRPAAVRSAARDLLLRVPGADVAKSTSASARRILREEERRLSPGDRARRGRALIGAGDARRGVRLILGSPSAAWPGGESASILLALARGQAALGRSREAEQTAGRVPGDAAEEHAQAVLLRSDLALARVRARDGRALSLGDPRVASLRRDLLTVTAPTMPRAARRAARERLVRIAADAGDFREGIDHAAALNREDRGTVSGFEPLWQLAWESYRRGDCGEARGRFETLERIYDDIWRDRRLAYWRARCLEREGRGAAATAVYRSLAAGVPPDAYALFARRRVRSFSPLPSDPLPDPSTATARYRRVDELLRLRMFEEAVAEARALEPARGRDLRVAEAQFALGRFAAAATAAKRAFPELGTAEEGRVPDGWRRLHYPLPDNGAVPAAAADSGLDPSLLLGLIRQESVFDAGAKSRAGAIGLTQLMPATAQTLVKSVLRVRYRRAFLYDPDVNARLGAVYLRRLIDRFGNNVLFALAAYNGGPTRMARVLRENAGRAEDEILESHPFHETRDYVRRVLLYSESYRALYPR